VTAAATSGRLYNGTRGALVIDNLLGCDFTSRTTAHLKAHLLKHLAHRLLLDHAELLVRATLSTGGGRG
jgi:hypothetical protein